MFSNMIRCICSLLILYDIYVVTFFWPNIVSVVFLVSLIILVKVHSCVTESTYQATGCVADSTFDDSADYCVLNAAHGHWPADGFCRILDPQSLDTKDYAISVDLYNNQGWSGEQSGHPGVFYNAKDANNFDVIYFR